MKRCPHADVQYCPLYVAAHLPDGGGCDDGRLDAGGCAVSRDLDYATEHARLARIHPGMVMHLHWLERQATMREQRRRNMRLNAIH